MPGKGPVPKEHRQRPRDEKQRARGTWQAAEAEGWQHGPVPKPPPKLRSEARAAWKAWFGAWYAAHWIPEDVHVLRRMILLFDRAMNNDASAAEQSELRYLLETFGITPKGQQDRRWKRPEQKAPDRPRRKAAGGENLYGHLRPVE